MSGSVSFVLCVDTEGPLYESIYELFKRVNSLFHLNLEPSNDTLAKLRSGEIPLNGIEEAVQKVVDPGINDRIDNWDGIIRNLSYSKSEKVRKRLLDDDGNPVIFNWYICDWVDFTNNPRRKTIGLNGIFSNYYDFFGLNDPLNPLYFHHHGIPYSGFSNHPCKNWSNTNSHIKKLSATLLDYGHFSASVRTPIMAPDINNFLDQHFPFDLSNTSADTDDQPDVENRRFSDWIEAPDDWSIYSPDYLNYKKPGSMKRHIGRCLQLGSRYGNLTSEEIKKAFIKAERGEHVLMSGHMHDWKHITGIFPYFDLINETRKNFPSVKYVNSTAVDAFHHALDIKATSPVTFKVELSDNIFICKSDNNIFGPQPWFCLKLKSGEHYWDNMDRFGDTHWQYIFDGLTVPLEAVERIGIAANDFSGNTTCELFNLHNNNLLRVKAVHGETEVL